VAPGKKTGKEKRGKLATEEKERKGSPHGEKEERVPGPLKLGQGNSGGTLPTEIQKQDKKKKEKSLDRKKDKLQVLEKKKKKGGRGGNTTWKTYH